MIKFYFSKLLIPLFYLGLLNNLIAQNTKIDTNVYRVYSGIVNGFNIWIVDGKIVRETIVPEFLYGGNHERYQIVPSDEIWIDHAISCEEFNYTLKHELCERELMAISGWNYDSAHDYALMVEQKLRFNDLHLKLKHEQSLHKVLPTDYYQVKEIQRLGDSIQLHGIYRIYVGKRDSIDIWIVDGSTIRRDIYPDFGLSGNDLAYHFIPSNELWLDSQISCEEMEFSIHFELFERKLMLSGIPYDDAYEKALMSIRNERIELSRRTKWIHKDWNTGLKN